MRKLIVLVLVLLLLFALAGIGAAGTAHVDEKPSGAKVVNGDFMAPKNMPASAVEYGAVVAK